MPLIVKVNNLLDYFVKRLGSSSFRLFFMKLVCRYLEILNVNLIMEVKYIMLRGATKAL